MSQMKLGQYAFSVTGPTNYQLTFIQLLSDTTAFTLQMNTHY